MISDSTPGMSWFLLIAGLAFLLGAALPLLIDPIWWAKIFQWKTKEDSTGLTSYLGRCLGGTGLVMAIFAFRVAPDPASHPWIIELFLWTSAIMAVVHGVGAIQGRQPWTENVEIAMYVGICVLGLWLYLGI